LRILGKGRPNPPRAAVTRGCSEAVSDSTGHGDHIGRSLTCSACGESRHVESGVRITNRAAVLEWLLGASGAPRVTERKP
jgi:hypothetical protein